MFYRFCRDEAVTGPYWLEFAPYSPLHEVLRSDLVGRAIAFTGFYELDLSKEIAARARSEGGLLIDVGANIGYFSHLWLGARPGNRVIAFEASPRVFPILKRNIEAHSGWSSRVVLHELAASDLEGTVTFDVGPPDQTGWGGIAGDGAQGELVEVMSVRLDEVLPKDTQVDFLKVDVEGADSLVVLGAERLFKDKAVRAGCFEVNPDRASKLGLTPDSAIQLLKDCGYALTLGDGECLFRLEGH